MIVKRHFLNMKRWVFCFVFLLIFVAPLESKKNLHLEKEYQTQWCNRAGGEMEVRLEDETRVDCLTSEYAIEFDFGKKWAEAIGQSLHYSQETGRQGGIVLILEHENDYKYWKRLNKIIDKANLNIKTWIMQPQDLT